MASLKNMIAQKKTMIGEKAQQFLEEKPLPQAISSSSPILGGRGRRMAAGVSRESRSSQRSPFMQTE